MEATAHSIPPPIEKWLADCDERGITPSSVELLEEIVSWKRTKKTSENEMARGLKGREIRSW